MADKYLEVSIDDADESLLVDTAEAKAKGDPKAKEEPKAERKAADTDPIESLKRQLDEAKAESARERDARLKAEGRANEFEVRSHRATTNTIASQIDSVESAIALAKEEGTRAERELAAALEVADHAAAAKAQRIIARSESTLLGLEQGRRQLNAESERLKAQTPQPQVVDPNSPEAFVSHLIANGTPSTRAYVEKNREHLTTRRAVDKVQAIHQLALADGLQADTPDYFAFIDQQMGWGGEGGGEKTETPAKQARTVAAPVSRDSNQANGDLSGGKVRLTKEQVDYCREAGLDPVKYAKNILKIKANGRDPMADGLRFSADIK